MANEDKNQRKIQLVVTDDAEWERYLEVLRRAKSRNPTLKNSDVNRVLLGLALPNDFVTKDDVLYFQGREKRTGRAPVGKPADEPASGQDRKANGGNKKR